MKTPSRTPKLTRRTSLISAGAIAGVLVAGTIAVGANIGILSAADDTELGSLSAAADLGLADGGTGGPTTKPAGATSTPTSTPVGTGASVPGSAQPQEFAVDAAGIVAVVPTAEGIRLGPVVANEGWRWSSSQSSPSAIDLTFTDGTRVLEFSASIASDGSITAAVVEPTGASTTSGTSGSTQPSGPEAGSGDDDSYEDDEDEDEEEHEGRDDDD